MRFYTNYVTIFSAINKRMISEISIHLAKWSANFVETERNSSEIITLFKNKPLVDTENVLLFWRYFNWLVLKPVRKMCAFGAHFDEKSGRRRATVNMRLVDTENVLLFWCYFNWLVLKPVRKMCAFWAHFNEKTGRWRATVNMPLVDTEHVLHFGVPLIGWCASLFENVWFLSAFWWKNWSAAGAPSYAFGRHRKCIAFLAFP